MNVIGDIMFPTGTYQTREGEEKTRWLKCGVLMQNTEGNYRIKLEAMPLGVEPDGAWFAVFEKERQQPAAPKQQGFRQPAALDGLDDEMPF
jgi:hypothetical protein